jgi:hypothetical protein
VLEGVFLGVGAASLVAGATILIVNAARARHAQLAVAPSAGGLKVRF